jgi:hypothetical protein
LRLNVALAAVDEVDGLLALLLRRVLRVLLVWRLLTVLRLILLLRLAILLPSILLLTILLSSILLPSILLLTTVLWLLRSSAGQSFEQHEQFRLGDNSIPLQVESLHVFSGFLCSKSSGFVELHVELVEEGVQLIHVEVTIAVGIVDVKDLVDEHA